MFAFLRISWKSTFCVFLHFMTVQGSDTRTTQALFFCYILRKNNYLLVNASRKKTIGVMVFLVFYYQKEVWPTIKRKPDWKYMWKCICVVLVDDPTGNEISLKYEKMWFQVKRKKSKKHLDRVQKWAFVFFPRFYFSQFICLVFHIFRCSNHVVRCAADFFFWFADTIYLKTNFN